MLAIPRTELHDIASIVPSPREILTRVTAFVYAEWHSRIRHASACIRGSSQGYRPLSSPCSLYTYIEWIHAQCTRMYVHASRCCRRHRRRDSRPRATFVVQARNVSTVWVSRGPCDYALYFLRNAT